MEELSAWIQGKGLGKLFKGIHPYPLMCRLLGVGIIVMLRITDAVNIPSATCIGSLAILSFNARYHQQALNDLRLELIDDRGQPFNVSEIFKHVTWHQPTTSVSKRIRIGPYLFQSIFCTQPHIGTHAHMKCFHTISLGSKQYSLQLLRAIKLIWFVVLFAIYGLFVSLYIPVRIFILYCSLHHKAWSSLTLVKLFNTETTIYVLRLAMKLTLGELSRCICSDSVWGNLT